MWMRLLASYSMTITYILLLLLLMQEISRRLASSCPDLAGIFGCLSRDEARHAGFCNKAMSDFNLALDLGFLTRKRCVLC
jgi:hypothetical protein